MESNNHTEENYIWVLWWQGEENAPPLVKACIKSIRKNCGDANVIILDKDNYSEWVYISENLAEKFKTGYFSVTHFSDIIRANILFQRGGLWLDSTIYLTSDIPKEIFEREFYSLKGADINDKSIANRRWTSFLIGGRAGNEVCKCLSIAFENYWSKHNRSVAYLLLDFCLDAIYDKNIIARNLIDKLPYYEYGIFDMASILKNDFDMADIADFGTFNKLSWKEDYSSGTSADTLYKKILLANDIEVTQNSNNVRSENKLRRKLRSFFRHFKNLFNFGFIKEFGFGISLSEFFKSCFRTSNSKFAIKITKKYNNKIKKYINNQNILG